MLHNRNEVKSFAQLTCATLNTTLKIQIALNRAWSLDKHDNCLKDLKEATPFVEQIYSLYDNDNCIFVNKTYSNCVHVVRLTSVVVLLFLSSSSCCSISVFIGIASFSVQNRAAQ